MNFAVSCLLEYQAAYLNPKIFVNKTWLQSQVVVSFFFFELNSSALRNWKRRCAFGHLQSEYGKSHSPIKTFRTMAKLRQRDDSLVLGDIKLADPQNGLVAFTRQRTDTSTGAVGFLFPLSEEIILFFVIFSRLTFRLIAQKCAMHRAAEAAVETSLIFKSKLWLFPKCFFRREWLTAVFSKQFYFVVTRWTKHVRQIRCFGVPEQLVVET